MARLSALHIYPVKGLKGLDVEAAEVEPWGLAQDRRWMIVDERGRFLSQRQQPRMAILAPQLTGDGLRITVEDRTIEVATPVDRERIPVQVWHDTVTAVPAGREADLWLADVLGVACRLVHMADPAVARPVDPAFARPEDRVSFADGFPMLATVEASLADLNARLANPVPMDRFRPNLVVEGPDPWAEDGWRSLMVGSVTFRAAKDCARCAVPTVDQVTGVRSPDNEPIRTLTTFRRTGAGRIIFGQNLIPDGRGILRVGDPVAISS